jgi:hypothetical protein
VFDNIYHVAFNHYPRQLADNGDDTVDYTFADAF